MHKRPNSILGLALHYAKLRLQNPATRTSTVLAFGLAGATLTAITAMAVRSYDGASGTSCQHTRSTHTHSTNTQHMRPASAQIHCQTLVVRARDQRPVRSCMPQWAWDGLATTVRGDFVRPRDGQSFALMPSLVSNGDGYAMAFSVLTEHKADVYFQRLSPGGERIGPAVRVSASNDGNAAIFPSIAWTGSGYAIAWTELHDEEQLDVYFARVDPAGAVQGTIVKVSESNELDLFARVAVSQGRTSVAWIRFNGEDQMSARFRFYDGAGSRVGNEIALRDVLIVGMPSLLPTRQGFAFGYNTFDLRRAQSVLTLYRMGPEGQGGSALLVNAERKINAAVAMASDGEAFNFVWEDGMFEDETNTLAFARVAGSRVETRRTALTNGRTVDLQPAVAVAPDGITGVTWTHADPRTGRPTVVFARVGKNGRTVGDLLTLPRAGGDALFSSIAWGGREYLVAWTEVRDNHVTIEFGRVSADGRRPQ